MRFIIQTINYDNGTETNFLTGGVPCIGHGDDVKVKLGELIAEDKPPGARWTSVVLVALPG